ncbi:hypothetical protein [Scytonema sp. UIC 10036]|uniref:hypothetical protein n=1 Tax=Scytonema sp. UIC 10036 TaxID=2304196 RepID=UPI00140FE921|nr:hypothetical protein [Scytonema sp. UIC 10036]
MALESLEVGNSPVNVMHRYQVAVVSHGSPQREDIEAFREQLSMGWATVLKLWLDTCNTTT